ncbi:MAG: hypothetical protein LBH35_07280 [Treponema sp.]|jgi:hypothetical protein|nr:hypothetical protein [Treponema sp.]
MGFTPSSNSVYKPRRPGAKRLFVLAAALFPVFLAACTQEPLFWYISLEYPPIDPIIGGSPTEIVKLGTTLYVANRTSLWEYDTTVVQQQWRETAKPPSSGYIKAIAVTPGSSPSALYVLDEGGTIHKFSSGWTSSPIPGAQQIYGADDELFVGDGSAVYDYSSPTTPISGPGGLLRGAVKVGSDYYICTARVRDNDDTGIFKISSGIVTKEYPSSGNSSIKGIIAAGTTTVVAVDDEGFIIYKDSLVTNFNNPISTGLRFSGGMARWEGGGGDKKILLGLQRGSGTFRYGYRELDLDTGGDVDASGIYTPGTTNGGARKTSISPDSRETSAIGKYPVTALYVISGSNSGDGRPIIVASTQKDGMWSYRTRRGVPQWNGEDNSN